MASRLLEEGAYKSAEVYLRQGLLKAPKHPMAPTALVDLARCAFKDGDIFQAQFYLQESLRIKPANRAAHLRLCALATQLGDWAELCRCSNAALLNFPHDAEFVCLLNVGAVALNPLGTSADEASIALSQVRPVTPRDELFVRIARAAILIGRGEHGRAVSRLRALTQAADAPLIATICLCRALIDSGHPLEARLSAREALRKFPGDLQLLIAAIESYLAPGHHFSPNHALDLAEVVVQRTNWLNSYAMVLLSRSYGATGDRMAALAVAQHAYQVAKGRISKEAVSEVEQLMAELREAQVA
jgi:tetratricopeptide (TPR) repeat protein